MTITEEIVMVTKANNDGGLLQGGGRRNGTQQINWGDLYEAGVSKFNDVLILKLKRGNSGFSLIAM